MRSDFSLNTYIPSHYDFLVKVKLLHTHDKAPIKVRGGRCYVISFLELLVDFVPYANTTTGSLTSSPAFGKCE